MVKLYAFRRKLCCNLLKFLTTEILFNQKIIKISCANVNLYKYPVVNGSLSTNISWIIYLYSINWKSVYTFGLIFASCQKVENQFIFKQRTANMVSRSFSLELLLLTQRSGISIFTAFIHYPCLLSTCKNIPPLFSLNINQKSFTHLSFLLCKGFLHGQSLLLQIFHHGLLLSFHDVCLVFFQKLIKVLP